MPLTALSIQDQRYGSKKPLMTISKLLEPKAKAKAEADAKADCCSMTLARALATSSLTAI